MFDYPLIEGLDYDSSETMMRKIHQKMYKEAYLEARGYNKMDLEEFQEKSLQLIERNLRVQTRIAEALETLVEHFTADEEDDEEEEEGLKG